MEKQDCSNTSISYDPIESLRRMSVCEIDNKKNEINDLSKNPKCSKEDLKNAISNTSKLLVIHTQPNCDNCSPFMGIVDELFGKEEDIIYAELSSKFKSCSELAEDLSLIGTPTTVYYENGIEKARYSPEGKTPEQVKTDLLRLVN